MSLNINNMQSDKKEVKSYLGNHGYVLYKKFMQPSDLLSLKKELTVKPNVSSNYGPEAEEFPVFDENAAKIYIPKVFGINKFGTAEEDRIPRGKDIDVKFSRELRQNQLEPVKACLDAFKSERRGGILELGCGMGKCEARNTPILMYNGSVKMIQDINIRDKLMGDDSKPRNVRSTIHGESLLFRVVPEVQGFDSYTVNDVHILSLIDVRTNVKRDIEIMDYLQLSDKDKSQLYGYRVSVEFAEKEVINPYEFGKMLNNIYVDYDNKDVLKYNNIIRKNGKYICIDKHIPDDYKINSKLNRLRLLQGIFYNYTHKNKVYEGKVYIEDDNIYFLEDVAFVCKTLGYIVVIKNIAFGMEGLFLYRLTVYGHGADEIIGRIKATKSCISKTPIRIERAGYGEYFGFEIDGNRRYLHRDCTVTHNTAIGLYLASQLKKKTLVIVHKEFLMNQWVERIKEFLPDAKIGILQQNKMEIEGKDIVIAMLQSIVMKNYPDEMFADFGFEIIDECHRIPCQHFSKALKKINTYYSLGLSATPNRKDGLSKVLKWFVGDVVYSLTQHNNNNLMIERVIITSENEYYQKEEFMFNGKMNLAKMINNITDNLHRTNVIIEYIKRYIEEDRHILLLSDRRKHLEEIYAIITKNNICSVGYYVGGMKEKHLKLSETKSLILGTFCMAREGLDIPVLDTLILASPTGDIVQALGRIMRKQHADRLPTVLDIVDNFSVFIGQAKKRFKYLQTKQCQIYDTRVIDNGCKEISREMVFDSTKNIKDNIVEDDIVLNEVSIKKPVVKKEPKTTTVKVKKEPKTTTKVKKEPVPKKTKEVSKISMMMKPEAKISKSLFSDNN